MKEQLKHLLDGDKIEFYYTHFSTLVFYELEQEKKKPTQYQNEEQNEPNYNPEKMSNVLNIFKDV